jgi:hypothetical protein
MRYYFSSSTIFLGIIIAKAVQAAQEIQMPSTVYDAHAASESIVIQSMLPESPR